MKNKPLWNEIAFIKSSKYREGVLKAIINPINPTKLKKELNIDKAHISRALKSLIKENLAICLTPNSRKFKLFTITNLGKKVLEKIDKL